MVHEVKGAFTFYLNRMYAIEFGKRIEWNRPYKVEEELDTWRSVFPDLLPENLKPLPNDTSPEAAMIRLGMSPDDPQN